MLRSVRALDGLRIRASDGDLGRLVDFYFDDEHWSIQYLVVKTGLLGREVLLAAASLREAQWDLRSLGVQSSREQLRDGRGVDLVRPVSQAYESLLREHNGAAPYWQAGGAWTGGLGPAAPGAGYGIPQAWPLLLAEQLESAAPVDYHLRSAQEMTGYRVEAIDGEVGRLDDFLVDDDTWTIPYLVVGARPRGAAGKILLASQWVEGTGFPVRRVRVCVRREAAMAAPRWERSVPVTPEMEERLLAALGKGNCRQRAA